MGIEDVPDTLGEVLEERHQRDIPHGEYHPSTISGCSIKAFIKKMVGGGPPLNKWLFNGSAVHHYLQETGRLTEAMKRAGFHPINTNYEVPTQYHLEDGIWIDGRCDVLAEDENGYRTIIDIKYSSIPAHSGHGRLYKYAAQANAYANMFNADQFGLLMINSKSGGHQKSVPDTIPEGIAMISHDADEETWEKTLQKARNIHGALEDNGYEGDPMWELSDLKQDMDETIEMLAQVFEEWFKRANSPSYDKECQYCDYKEVCPVKQGEVGGLNSL